MGIPTGWELILLLGVLVLLFGATKLPTAARAIGQSMRIFKAETKGMRSDDDATSQAPTQPSPQQSLPPSRPTAAPVEETQRHNDTTDRDTTNRDTTNRDTTNRDITNR